MASHDSLDSAANALTGPFVLPDDPAYDDARRPWNLAVEQHPAAVATPAGVDDLRALLTVARQAGSALAVQPSGHGADGDLAGAIIVRMPAFDEFDIDLDAATARIGAGVPWGRVIDALEGTGYVAPAGTSAVVSATGYTLGGGHSWFSRTAGLGSEALRAVWLLRTDGTHERVDDASDPDAMWALRGAGGLVGVVTAIEIDLVPAPALVGGTMTFDADDAPAVIRAARDLAAGAPAALNLFVSSMRMPDAPQLPEAIRGRSFVTVESLILDGRGSALLDPIRGAAPVVRENFGATTVREMAEQAVEPTEPTASRATSAALGELDDDLIDALVEFRERREQAPLVGLGLRMLGGALDTPRRDGFASMRGAQWLAQGLAPVFPGAPTEPGRASLAGLREVLAVAETNRTVPTFLAEGETFERSADDAALTRLRTLRTRFDPAGVLHPGRLRA